MKIDCGTIEDFCQEVAADCRDGRIVHGVVRLRVDRVPEQEERISFDVWLTATALVDLGGTLAVIEFRQSAGMDRVHDEPGSSDGTLEANRWIGLVRRMATDCDLVIRGGRLELV